MILKGWIMNDFDNVNHPKHYTEGKYEFFDIMLDIYGVEAMMCFCQCNAFKII